MKKILHLLFFAILFANLSFGQIVITEINYNSYGTDDSDYLELYNNSGAAIEMEGYSFSEGVEYVFPSMTFAADEFMVLAASAISLLESHGIDALQWTAGSLGNAEDILLKDANGLEIDYVLYDSAGDWSILASGNGFSLQLCDVNSDNNLVDNWQVSIAPDSDFQFGSQKNTFT